MSDETDRLMIATAQWLNRMDSVVKAVMLDLGESPEAIRGAAVVCETMRHISRDVLRPGCSDDEHEMEAEQQCMGLLAMSIAQGVHMKCLEFLP